MNKVADGGCSTVDRSDTSLSPVLHGPVSSWFELVPVLAACGVVFVGGSAMVLAWFGSYRPLVALVIGGAFLVAVWGVLRGKPRERDRDRSLSGIGLVVLFAAYGGLLAVAPSEHLYVDRDPAVYNNTAAWISSTGSLRVDVGPMAALDDRLVIASPGDYLEGDSLEFQFAHLTGAFLAVVLDVASPWLMFRTSALVTAAGLLAVYAVARRLTGRSIVALIAPGILAVSMPMVAVGRDTYSEPYALLLLWSGVLLLVRTWDRPRDATAAVGGLLIGAGLLARLDASIYVAIALPLLVLPAALGHRQPGRSRAAFVTLGSMAAASAVGVVDLWVFSTGYVRQHRDQVLVLAGILVISVVATFVVWLVGRSEGGRAMWLRWREHCAILLSAIVAIAIALLWCVRPGVQTVRAEGGVYLVEVLQRAEGRALDGTRLYHEESLSRMGWYLGVVGLVVSLSAGVRAVAMVVRGRATASLTVVSAIFVVCGGLYFWNPSIAPDHVWAMRRFVPALLPALVLLMTAAFGWYWPNTARSFARRPLLLRRTVASVVLIVAVAVPAIATWPVYAQREQYGMYDALHETCATMPVDAVALVVGEESVQRIMQTLRSWCGIDVAGLPRVDDPATLGDVRTRIESQGRELVIVTTQPDYIRPISELLGPATLSGVAVNDRQLRKTIEQRPDEYTTEQFQFWVYELA